MRPAELFFRLGCGLVGWIVVYAYLLMVAVIPRSDCSLGNDGLWLPTFVMVVIVLAALIMMPFGLFMRDTLRWLAVPLVLLWPMAVFAVLPYFSAATMDTHHVCSVLNPDFSPSGAAGWHRWWAPAQFAALGGVAWIAWRYWGKQAGPTLDS